VGRCSSINKSNALASVDRNGGLANWESRKVQSAPADWWIQTEVCASCIQRPFACIRGSLLSASAPECSVEHVEIHQVSALVESEEDAEIGILNIGVNSERVEMIC